MKQGTLFFDPEDGRYTFNYTTDEGYDTSPGGFHCGDCFEVQLNGTWIVTRIEMDANRNWYLVGLPGLEIEGLLARIP